MSDIITDLLSETASFYEDLLKQILTFILDGMFTYIDLASNYIATYVSETPETWNPSIFTTLRGISQTVILPIGTIIITAVLCYEIINMVTEQNHLGRDGGEMKLLFLIIFKAMVAVYFLAHSFDFTMAIFDVGSHVVTNVAGGYLGSSPSTLSLWDATTFESEIDSMNIAELLIACIEAALVNTAISIMALLIMVVLYGRMMEIYMYVSISPIPFSTFINREWGVIGNNYIKNLCALSFQAFFIIVCVAIFNGLVAGISTTTLIKGLWDVLTYSVLLCLMLFKSGTISRSIFNAH